MDYTQARVNMVKSQAVPNLVRDSALLAGLMKVPREAYVATTHRELAYSDMPIPWDETARRSLTPLQTAWLIQAMKVKAGDRVLVVGAGSGYEAALLANMGAEVFALEADAALAARGEALTKDLKVRWQVAPVIAGWSGEGSFNAILIGGAIPAVPDKIMEQLDGQGVLVTVIGQAGDVVMPAVAIQATTAQQEVLFQTVAPVMVGFEAEQKFKL